MEGFQRRLELADDIQELILMSKKQQWAHDFNFEHQLVWLNKTIVVTDPGLRIVYASSNILHMNGYAAEEVLGQRPSMFQGPDTSADTKSMIRDALDRRMPIETSIVNYRKTGEPYMCVLEEYPLFNHKMDLVNFVAFECIA